MGSSAYQQVAAFDYDEGTYADPILSYEVEVGDEFVYNLFFNITMGFENTHGIGMEMNSDEFNETFIEDQLGVNMYEIKE